LHRHCPIGKEQVDAFAPDAAASKGGGNLLSDLKHPATDARVKIAEVGSVTRWHDQHLTRVDWLYVHEGDHVRITVNNGRRRGTRDDAAEDAVFAS
jgi:hypothetical protein